MRYLLLEEVNLDWILFFKETIGVSLLIPWLLLRWYQGRLLYISKRLIFYILIAAVICQLIGSHLQLLGYAVIGLIISVPLIQSSTLLGVAILGAVFLGDPLSKKRQYAVAVLITAVTILSIGKALIEPVSPQPETVLNPSLFLLAAAGAVLAGLSFSVYTIILRYVIRRYWKDEDSPWKSFSFRHWAGSEYKEQGKNSTGSRFYSPFPVTLLAAIVLGAGVIIFGTCLYAGHGASGFVNVPPFAWYLIPISAVCNAVGFFFQIQGLRMTTAVQASLVAVAQIILLSFVGYLYFDEAVNSIVIFGLVLTSYGVIISAKPENS
ncbi:hypothetical protein FACS189419_04410 [Planctomycetales bacterium]|nr:hypothetical protein FACS189419_04410 [Planctomycetales bacterium]